MDMNSNCCFPGFVQGKRFDMLGLCVSLTNQDLQVFSLLKNRSSSQRQMDAIQYGFTEARS